MACPYFYPLERRAEDTDPRSAMLPLGDAWTGQCHAVSGSAPHPEPETSPRACWLGYARGHCSHFPQRDAGPDAVRFTLSGDDGVSLRLYYVLERDHHPFAHGPLEYSMKSGRFDAAPSPQILRRQAEAYVQSYLRRKKEASLR